MPKAYLGAGPTQARWWKQESSAAPLYPAILPFCILLLAILHGSRQGAARQNGCNKFFSQVVLNEGGEICSAAVPLGDGFMNKLSSLRVASDPTIDELHKRTQKQSVEFYAWTGSENQILDLYDYNEPTYILNQVRQDGIQ